MNLEQLIHYGDIPPSLAEKEYQPYHTNSMHHLSSNELDTLLMQAQKGYDPGTDGELIVYLDRLIALEATGSATASISQQDENTINLISLLFKQIAANTTQRNADLFMMLSVPYARLALKDLTLLSNANHPARQALDKLIYFSQSHLSDQAFQLIRFFATAITLRFSQQKDFFSNINTELQKHYRSFNPGLEQQLQELSKQLDPQKKRQMLELISRSYAAGKMAAMPQQLSFFVLFQKFINDIFWQIGAESKQVIIDWLKADQDISEFLHLFDKRNILQFKDAHSFLGDHVKTLNKYLQQIKAPLSLRRVFFEQLQQLLSLIVKGEDLYSLQDQQLKHSDNLNKEIDHLLRSDTTQQSTPGLLGHENQALKPAFTQAQSADTNAIANLQMGQWLNIMIDGQRTPCKIHFHSMQQQSLFFYSPHHQQLFERNGGDVVIDLQLGYAKLLKRYNSFEQAIKDTMPLLQKWQPN